MSAAGSRWDIARTSTPCATLGCSTVIGAGEQLRRVGPGQWPICVECCRRRFDLEPPAEMPTLSFLDRMQQFKERTGFVSARDTVRDYKIAQMAREPGEEG